MNPYKLLGVSEDAAEDAIRAAYREKVKDVHPDVGGDEEKFIELKLAHDVLLDEDLRARYDQTGKIDYERKPSRENEIAQTLAELFGKIIDAGIGKKRDVDIIKVMQESTRNHVAKVHQVRQDQLEQRTAMQELSERISCSGEINRLQHMLGKKLAQTQKRVDECDHILDIADGVMDELQSYDCLVDIARHIEFHVHGFTSTSTTSATGSG